jgi:hypothetical protein
MLTRSVKQAVTLVALCTAALVCVGAQTSTNKDRTPVSREQVAEVLRSAGIDTSADQLQPLSNATAVPGAPLRVIKLKEKSARGLLAELACQDARECLPFYVLIQRPVTASNGSSKLPEIRLSPTAAKKTERPLVVRGQSVTLVMEKTNVRIMLSAICMEGGMPGQTIRVSSPDRKRVYTAEVVSHNLVRGTL